MNHLAPYLWQSPNAWTRRQAGHLLRRAGFAPSEAEIQQALADGLDMTVERLLAAESAEGSRFTELDKSGETLAARSNIEKLAGWWMSRLIHSQRPLAMRMTLLWHNHFATSNVKVQSPPMMLRQMRTLETSGMGRFDELLLAMSRDPAMIMWLDGDSNRKDKPNENYARELFELFSLGPGHYTEQDLREAARAFSGWHQKDGVFAFNDYLHDAGSKTVLGRTGPLNGDDVVQLAIEHSACAAFIARKLAREFVSDSPNPALVSELGAIIRAEQFEMTPVLRRLLLSRALFAPENYRARIKSPVEFCVGLVRSFEMRAPGESVHAAASQMGQRLFEPPTVKGWEGARRWINSSNMLVRMNAAGVAAAGNEGKGLNAARWTASQSLSTNDDAIEFALGVMLDGVADESLRAALRDHCGGTPDEALRTAVAAIAASPEYQLA